MKCGQKKIQRQRKSFDDIFLNKALCVLKYEISQTSYLVEKKESAGQHFKAGDQFTLNHSSTQNLNQAPTT